MNQYSSLNIYCDGGARGNPGPAAVGIVIKKSPNEVITKFGKIIGEATNNVAEYSAVVAAFEYLVGTGIKAQTITIYLDSQVVGQQLRNFYKVKKHHLRELFLKVRLLEQKVGGEITYKVISREENTAADLLVNQALDQA